MAFVESWVETDPDGSIITGSLLDDYQRQTKRALRERLEGDPAAPLTGIFEVGSWAAAPIPRAGTARMYYGTDAAINAMAAGLRQDGRLAFATDTGTLYHAATAGMVAIGRSPRVPASTSPSFLVIDTAATAVGAGLLFSTSGESIVVQSHNTNARFASVAFGNPPQFLGYRGNGTSAAPTQVVNGSVLMSLGGRGYTSLGSWTTSSAAFMEFVATEGWSAAFQGAYVSIGASTNLTSTPVESLAVRSTSVAIPATNRLYLDGTVATGDTYIYEDLANRITMFAGGTNRFAVNGPAAAVNVNNSDFTVDPTKKLYLDGGGDTYIWESSANHMTGVVGGVTAFDITTSGFTLNTGLDLLIQPTKKLYLDGGGNTYIWEQTADVINFVAGGANVMSVQGSYAGMDPGKHFYVAPTSKIYLDGVGDTYISEVSPNTFMLTVGGVNVLGSNAALVIVQSGAEFAVNPTKKLYLDAGGDTYLLESSANVVKLFSGATESMGWNAGNVWVQPLTKFFLDGGSDTYIVEAAANQINFNAGGAARMSIDTSNVTIGASIGLVMQATQKFYLDGGSDTYLFEAAANDLRVVAGGAVAMGFIATGSYLNSLQKLWLDGAGDTYIVESAANVLDLVAGGTTALSLTATQGTFAGFIKTGAPSTGGAGTAVAFKHGAYSAGGVIAATGNIDIEQNGHRYNIPVTQTV